MKNLKKVISFILIFIGVILGAVKIISNKIEKYKEDKKIENYFEYNYKNPELVKKNDYYNMVIEIPKINLKKGVSSIESQYNNINYNIEILKESTMPNTENSTLILASHSGNSKISYFRNIHKLRINDLIYIYFNNKKYTYKIDKYYELEKNNTLTINKSNLTLVTCKKNSKYKQLILQANLLYVF